MKQRIHRHTGSYDPRRITKAVTHIRLEAANAGKLAALDDLARVYMPLCQQYVTLFCTDEYPDKFRTTCFATPLSERWQRVAIQQAAVSPNLGAPTESRPIRTTWMICWTITRSKRKARWVQR